jgi:hypothetical protein
VPRRLVIEGMTESKNKSGMPQGIVQTVFADFLSRLEKDSSIDSATIERLRDALGKNHYSVEKLKPAMFSEDTL